MRKRVLFVMTAVLAALLPACGVSAAKEQAFSTGVFKGIVPEGWESFPVEDLDTEDPDDFDAEQISIYKGAENEEDMLSTAGIDIKRCNLEEYEEVDMRKIYSDVKEISLELDGRTWTGYTGKRNKYLNLILECDDTTCHWSVSGVLKGYSSSFSVDDEDFQRILKSLDDYIAKKKAQKTEVKAETEKKQETEKQTEQKKETEKQTEAKKKETQKHEHYYQQTASQRSNCYENGYKFFECSCGESYSETLPLTSHEYYYSDTVEATCYRDGYDIYVCGNCGETQTRNYQSAGGHNYVFNYREPATCYSNGYDTYVCSWCGDIDSRNFVYSADHSWAYQYTVEATCYTQGYEVWQCNYCGYEEQRNHFSSTCHSLYTWEANSIYHVTQCHYCDYYEEDIHHMSDGYCIECGHYGPVG